MSQNRGTQQNPWLPFRILPPNNRAAMAWNPSWNPVGLLFPGYVDSPSILAILESHSVKRTLVKGKILEVHPGHHWLASPGPCGQILFR